MASVQHVTTASILKALKEYDKIGADKFHAKHETAPSNRYVIRHDGKDYPSKAIIAAAAGLSPKDFSGGAAALGSVLKRCGFNLVELKGE